MTTPTNSTPATAAEPTSFGQVGFDAYGNHPGPFGRWATFDGRPIPTWNELSDHPAGSRALTQERWEVAAQAIIAEHERRKAVGRSGKGLKAGEFTITVEAAEAEATMSRLEGRADSLVATLGTAVSLLEKLDPPRATVDTLNISPNDEELAEAPVDLTSAARTLAEARALVLNVEPNDPVRQLIDAAARALLESLAVKPAPADA
ncbi:hypothetical protein [Vitiosangium sp. GDMCC 1.1324]|uniref:hypothetical protein n=1 Tax=Vitiosangium sp. (strain GDMCC 1.1324) TaxID=2138576 RepID=UPI000D39D635|nr:hypothetical protein [Vitiosangium sp. GDMCC 1.1324]PTL79100.1 hypothetical protein DAT35_36440 [Vitiosangium sp. GDMCC 1.1324]